MSEGFILPPREAAVVCSGCRSWKATEYELCRKHFGFGDEELKSITRTAIDAAFCEESLKERLRQTV